MASMRTAPRQEVAKVSEASVEAISPEMAAMMKADAGQGISTAPEDNLVPLIYVLQATSPAVKKGDPSRIDGAEAGDFWLRNSSEPIVRGEDGLLFQPC